MGRCSMECPEDIQQEVSKALSESVKGSGADHEDEYGH